MGSPMVCCPHKCPLPDNITASIHSGTYGNPAGASLVGRECCAKDQLDFAQKYSTHTFRPAELAESVKFNTKRMACTARKGNEWAN